MEKILSNVNVVACVKVERKNSSNQVAVRVSKARVLKLPTSCEGERSSISFAVIRANECWNVVPFF